MDGGTCSGVLVEAIGTGIGLKLDTDSRTAPRRRIEEGLGGLARDHLVGDGVRVTFVRVALLSLVGREGNLLLLLDGVSGFVGRRV